MRVDLDEAERDLKEHGSIYEHAPAIIAELRAARECVRLLDKAHDLDWESFYAISPLFADALDAYDAATKGDG